MNELTGYSNLVLPTNKRLKMGTFFQNQANLIK